MLDHGVNSNMPYGGGSTKSMKSLQNRSLNYLQIGKRNSNGMDGRVNAADDLDDNYFPSRGDQRNQERNSLVLSNGEM